MGKKKDKKKDFSSVLEANAKKIKVRPRGQEEEKSVAEMVQESVDGTTACPIDAMIPITVTEFAQNTMDLPYMAVSTHYSEHVYSMYELGMKSPYKQTIIVPLSSNAAEGLMDDPRFEAVYETMEKYTNISLVIDELPKKIFKKLEAWADEEGGACMFVIRIPNLLMFHESIKKDVTATPALFDLVIAVSNASKRSLKKLRKGSVESMPFTDYTIQFTKDLLSIVDNYGSAAVHIPLWEEFYPGPNVAAATWAGSLMDTAKNRTGLKRLIFSTPDPKLLIVFNNTITGLLNKEESSGMRVV